MQVTDAYEPARGLRDRLARKCTALYPVAPLGRHMQDLVLSVAFDDAPLSAATRGADLLARHGARGSYYVATGLLRTTGVSGRILGPGDIRALAASGHEIALHGHAHIDMRRAAPATALADIARNRDTLGQILGTPPSPHFAYPYGETTLSLKRQLIGDIASARGVRGGVNGRWTDGMQLAAFDLRPEVATVTRALLALTRARRHGGWVIVFTHDVAPDPSPYGVSPAALDSLLAGAARLGARILPVGAAWARLAGPVRAAAR